MSEISAADFAELKRELFEQMGDLRKAWVELKEAETPREQEQAKGRLDDAEDDVEAAARRLGIKPDAYRKMISDARRVQFKEDNASVIREILDEYEQERKDAADKETDDDDDDDQADVDTDKKPKAKAKPKDPAGDGDKDADDPKGDDPPTAPHWSERGVLDILKR